MLRRGDKRPVIFPLGSLLNPPAEQVDLLRRQGRCVVRHARLGIGRSQARHKLRGIGVARHNGGPPRLALTQRVLAKYEGNTVFLAHSSVAGNAILVQDGTDVPAEFHSIVWGPMEERADWPNCKRGYRKDREGSGFRPGKAKRGRLGHGLTNQFSGKIAIDPAISWWWTEFQRETAQGEDNSIQGRAASCSFGMGPAMVVPSAGRILPVSL